MIIRSIILISVCFSCLNLRAQEIPNGDFESWFFNGWMYSPTDWTTDNTQVFQTAFRDSAAYQGEWALRVESMPSGIFEEGHATIQFPIALLPSALDFFVKYERTSTCGIGVNVNYYAGENMVYSNNWSPSDLSSDWTAVSIPFETTESGITEVRIDVWVLIGDEAPGDGWIAVDAMEFASPVGIGELAISEVQIYPNPVSDELIVNLGAESFKGFTFTLIDGNGQVVMEVPASTSVDVRDLPVGAYVLRIANQKGDSLSRSLLIGR